MKRRKLESLKREVRDARRSQQKARDLESLARRLGRKKEGGRHPIWVSTTFPLRPLSIPHHGGKDIPPGTRHSILDQLEEDLIAWDEKIEQEEEANEENGSIGEGNDTR